MEVLRTVILIVALSSGAVYSKPNFRIVDGTPVDTFARFPHHVTIHTLKGDQQIRYCSGSIIADQWILTSIGCVSGGDLYRLDFSRKYFNRSESTFSVVVFKDSVISYPTGFDDVALVKLPVKLVYSKYVQAIQLYTKKVGKEFVVMPGFGNTTGQLTYGMFEVVPNSRCENEYGKDFDTYLQMCASGWNNNRNAPCEGNQGGGLIRGWPREPQLVGVFSTPWSCKPGAPAIYMNISNYIKWIESIAGKLVEEEVNPTTTTESESIAPA